MENENGVPALWFPMRPDRTFGDPEVLEDPSIRVYNGGEIKSEMTLEVFGVHVHDSDQVDMREVEQKLRVEEEARSRTSSSEGQPDFVVSKGCKVVTGKQPWCLQNTCKPYPYWTCRLVTISGPGGTAAFCECVYQAWW